MLQANQISKTYITGKTPNPVIRKLDLTIRKGEFTVLMGSSGSGKSTLLHLLSGLDGLTEGEIWLEGEAIHRRSEKELALLRRKHMGFVFQQANLIPALSVLENVLVAGYLHKGNNVQIRQRAMELLQQAGLEGLEYRLPTQLSGGQQQRAAIVRALIHQPDILYADEPTGSLNSTASQAILDMLSDFHQQGQTVLMVTHDVKSACRGQQVLYFRDGRVVEECKLDSESLAPEQRELILTNWLTNNGW